MALQSLPSPRLNRPNQTIASPPPTSPTKRALLPAFEPLTSSPSLPRPSKRHAPALPSPHPTSQTGLSSSPIRPRHTTQLAAALQAARRPAGAPQPARGLHNQQTKSFRHATPDSTCPVESLRFPLEAVPSVRIPADGSLFRLGRSSNSSDYQLPPNRHISRVHLTAQYHRSLSPLEPGRVEIVCIGWNGFQVHCQGRVYALLRGDSFTCEDASAEILVDVHESRVLLLWPELSHVLDEEDDSETDEENWNESPSPAAARRIKMLATKSSPRGATARLRSPVSPSPETDSQRHNDVEIYEDADLDLPPAVANNDEDDHSVDFDATLLTTEPLGALHSCVSELSELSDPEDDHPNEENDPIVHSFGPFGTDLTKSFAAFSTSPSPARDQDPLDSLPASLLHYLTNQLAYSQLASIPLSTLLINLPPSVRTESLTVDLLARLLASDRSPACIGIIPRHGKDAAGKPLESEYYYIPENDTDEERRTMVVSGMQKRSIRACRKQHKQYFWKRPKTP